MNIFYNKEKFKSIINKIKGNLPIINRISLFIVEWNCYNGFIFNALNLEIYHNIFNIDGSIIGVEFSSTHIIINFMFVEINLYQKKLK